MEPTSYADAICGETLTAGIDDVLIMTVSRRGHAAEQTLWVRRECLASVLDSSIPLGEVFDRPAEKR